MRRGIISPLVLDRTQWGIVYLGVHRLEAPAAAAVAGAPGAPSSVDAEVEPQHGRDEGARLLRVRGQHPDDAAHSALAERVARGQQHAERPPHRGHGLVGLYAVARVLPALAQRLQHARARQRLLHGRHLPVHLLLGRRRGRAQVLQLAALARAHGAGAVHEAEHQRGPPPPRPQEGALQRVEPALVQRRHHVAVGEARLVLVVGCHVVHGGVHERRQRVAPARPERGREVGHHLLLAAHPGVVEGRHFTSVRHV
uniref:Uncharacterized protein n=1 Tax=Triticum urartu TaxID=4572 RepID=A0A8R7TMW3_TRIUA